MAIHRMRRNHSEVATPVPSQSGTGIRPVCLAVAFPKVFADVPQPVSKETGWKPVPPFAKPLPVFLDLKKLRGKQIVRRIGQTRRYESMPKGLKAMTALVVLRDKAINLAGRHA